VSRCGDLYENKITGERAVVLRGDQDGHGQSTLVHLTVRPHGAVVGEHIHPQFRERFLVISGRLGTRVDGAERTLVAGQETAAAPGPRMIGGMPARRRPRSSSSSCHRVPGLS
jgi:quercetin dioxygenase-like cupin family protein